jgi:poly(beta-D-mannuronate) C5 epimerase
LLKLRTRASSSFEKSALLVLAILIIASASTVSVVISESPSCITYDPSDVVITLSCKTANLRDINRQLNDPNILHQESLDGIWQLNAGIFVDKDATLYINSSDLSWLKILTKQGVEKYNKTNYIEVHGSLKIDSVKISSWDRSENDYSRNPGSRDLSENYVKIGTPRPYLSVESDATGTTDITNSELAYLGYEGGVGIGADDGLTYFGGEGSVIKNNNIHHLYFGFYSNGVGNITIENNAIHHNAHYGLDPHTGTHDMVIRNNVVHDNGGIGIICSLNCYNIIIENNKTYNNTKMGIMFSRNMYDSVARNNIVAREEKGIVISESHNNQIYNNHVLDSGRGIDLDKESYSNVIYNNTFRNIPVPSDALYIENGAAEKNILHFTKVSPSFQQIKSVNGEQNNTRSTFVTQIPQETSDPFS